ncbi:cytochrome C assembly family protein [Azohydromonas australica]|uniref:cytochrome C assembly family protein n=1 Tax=Azohydromonas australica TaxID=364039 RepID=UPI000491C71B|nr:cytochrome c biogenesis protein CcsA [Azohydromonas australica]
MILSSGPVAAAVAWPWLPALGAVLAYLVAMLPAPDGRRLHTAALQLGWVLHGVALVLEIAAIGREPPGVRFGFGPALSLTVWFVLAVHAVESRLFSLPGVRRQLATVGAPVVLLAAAFPGDIRLEGGSAWMPLHWLLGIASYGLFGAAVLHAMLLDRAERQMRLKLVPPQGSSGGPFGLPLLRLERLTFRFIEAGFVVLSAALLLGAWLSPEWRWDHKTVFSLLGWATFALLIGGRLAWGWRGRRATRWLYAGAVLLLLGYIGSRFVLEVVLHRTV